MALRRRVFREATGVGTGGLSAAQVRSLVEGFLTAGANITITRSGNSLTIASTATGDGTSGLDAEAVRDTVAAFIGTAAGPLSVVHDDNANTLTISIATATESVPGVVQNVSTVEAGDTAGSVFRAWSAAMITKLVALIWSVPSRSEAETGTATVSRLWTSLRVRQAVNAVVPAVFRTGDTSIIPAAKLPPVTLTSAWAQAGNTDTVPDNKIADSITRDTEIDPLLTGLSVSGNVLEGIRRNNQAVEVNLPIGRGLGRLGFWKPSANVASAQAATNQATGIILPVSPDDDAIFIFVTAFGGIEPIVRAKTGRILKSLTTSTAGSGGEDTSLAVDVDGNGLYGDRTAGNELLLSTDSDQGFIATSDFFALYEVTVEAPGDDPADGGLTFYQHWTDDPQDGTPPFTVTPVTSNTEIAANADYTQVMLTAALAGGLDLGAPVFIAYSGQLGIDLRRGAGESGRTLLLVELGYRLFPGTTNQVTFWREWAVEFAASAYVNIPLVAFETHSMFPAATYPTDAGGTVQVTQELFNAPVAFSLVLRLRGFAEGTTDFTLTTARAVADIDTLVSRDLAFTVYQIGRTEGPAISPAISDFTLEGDLDPAPGALSETYNYTYAVAQSSHLSALRIVRFTGTAAAPTSVTVLVTIAEADWHGGSGQLTVSGVTLAAGDTETVRLEGYGEGQTPATDQPITYHDVRITAHATTAATRFIRIQRRVGSPGARPTASTLVANMTVMQTAGSVIGDWNVSGIPNDNNAWLVGWIVPQSGAQPNHYTQGGFQIDNVVEDRFTFTQNSVDYWVYLFKDTNDVDDTFNGATLTVS